MAPNKNVLKEKLTLEEIRSMCVIKRTHFDNLIYEDAKARVWICRMTKDDGMPYNNQVTVDIYNFNSGCWNTHWLYEAK